MNEKYIKILGIIFTTLATVLVGALAYMFYNQVENPEEGLRTKLQKRRKALNTLEKKRLDLLNENLEMRAFVNGALDTSPVPIEEIYKGLLDGELKDFTSVAMKEDLRGKKYTKYIGIFGDLFAEIDTISSDIDDYRSKGETSWAQLRQVIRRFLEMKKVEDEKIARLRIDKQEILRRAQEELQALEEEVRELRKKVNEKAQQVADLKKYYERIVLKKLEERRNELDKVIAKLQETVRRRQSLKDLEPDGEVVATNEELGYVWLDLGRKHGARRGLIFQVFEYVKGGLRLPKGKIEVIQVDDKISQARVLELYHNDKPIGKGDIVVSPIFTRNQRQIFVFAGDKPVYKLYSVSRYRQMLEELNQIVESKVTSKTDFVVLLDGYEKRREYKEALRYPWIIFLREDDLLDFLKK